MMFLGLMVFNLILMILFFLGKKNRRSEPILTRLHDEDEVTFQTASSLEPEELGDVTEEKKIPTPFK